MSENADGKWVVLRDGIRVSEQVHSSASIAESEASAVRQSIHEQQGGQSVAVVVEVKQLLLG